MRSQNKSKQPNIDVTKTDKKNPIVEAFSHRWVTIPLAIILAFGFTVILLLFMGENPLLVYEKLFTGAFGQCRVGRDCGITVQRNLAEIFQAFVPLMLAASGLTFTFTTGLWNIGMEGQITMGAIFAYGAIRICMSIQMAPALTLILAILAGAIGGAFWGLMVGFLRIFGNVNEIFGGVGLNFIADAILLFHGVWSMASQCNRIRQYGYASKGILVSSGANRRYFRIL